MEGVITFASLVVGVAVTDQLLSLHRLLKARRQVVWDPLCLVVALLVQLTIIMVWWGVAGESDEPVTIGAFLPTFLVLVMLFLLAAATFPDGDDPHALDLRSYYDRNHPYIWALFASSGLFSSFLGIIQSIRADIPWERILTQYGPDLLVLGGGMGSLIFIKQRWWHWIVLAVLFVGPLNWLGKSLG